MGVVDNVIDDNDTDGITGGATFFTITDATTSSVDYQTNGAANGNTDYLIQIFENDPDADFSEGQTLVASTTITTGASGFTTGTIAATLTPGSYATGTATEIVASSPLPGSVGATTVFSPPVLVAPVVSFAITGYDADEGDTVDLEVQLSRVATGGETIDVVLDSGDPADLDAYTTQTITFTAGQTMATVSVDITDDGLAEPIETFTFEFDNESGLSVGTPDTATLEVAESFSTPVASFSVVQQAVSEGVGAVTLTIEIDREPDEPTALEVVLTTGNPADLGGFTSETLMLSGSETYTVTIPVTDDAIQEPTESFIFSLQADPDSVRFERASTSVVVVDNDGRQVTVTVPARDEDGDGLEDGGPRFVALPVGNVFASDLASTAGADAVYVLDASGALVALEDDAVIQAGQPVLVDVAPGADLTLTSSAPSGEILYTEAIVETGDGERVLVAVGNPTDRAVALEGVNVNGGSLADVVLVFDEASGAFRPVSLPVLSGAPVLAPYDAIVVQVVPDTDSSAVEVNTVSSLPEADGDRIVEAPYAVSSMDETALVLTLGVGGPFRLPAGAPGDSFVLRLRDDADTGLDDLDGLDLVSPFGGTLAGVLEGDIDALLAAFARDGLALGQSVEVPLAVGAPTSGRYEIAVAETLFGTISNRPLVVEILDGMVATTIEPGSPFAFDVADGEAGALEADRFAVRVSLGTAVSDEDAVLEAATLSVFPNPSSGSVSVEVSVLEAGPVRVAVYDVLGREVAVLYDGPVPVGAHRFEAEALSPGSYLIRVQAPGLLETSRLTVAR